MLLMYFVLGCHWANNGGFEEIHWDSQPSPYHETGIYNLHDIVDSYGITVGQYTIRSWMRTGIYTPTQKEHPFTQDPYVALGCPRN